jgi:hypothetical protein
MPGHKPKSWKMLLMDVKKAVAAMNPPTNRLWVTETTYNLNGTVPGTVFSLFKCLSLHVSVPLLTQGFPST